MLSIVVLHITEYFCNILVYLSFTCVILLQRGLKKKWLWLLLQWRYKELIFIKLDSKGDLCIAYYYKNVSRVRFWVSYMLLVISLIMNSLSNFFIIVSLVEYILSEKHWTLCIAICYFFSPDDQYLLTFLCKNLKNIMNRLDNILRKKLKSFLNPVLIFSLKTLKISYNFFN